MRRPGLRGAFWPSRKQEAILRTILAEPDEARRAWAMVSAGLDLDTMPYDSLRLMPLVSKRLPALGVDDPALPRMKGLHRKAWLLNQMALKTLDEVLEMLAAVGIEAIVLKGAALITQVYRDAGARSMGDLDLLVRGPDSTRALEVLTGAGWSQEVVPWERALRVYPGINLYREGHTPVDLHWHLLSELMLTERSRTPAELFWDAAVPLQTASQTAMCLSPSDLLLHVVLHGARAFDGGGPQWAADAGAIVRGGGVDWERVVDLSERYRVGIRMSDILRYLSGLGVPVPSSALARLGGHRPGARERLVAWVETGGGPLTGRGMEGVARHLRATERSSVASTIASMPRQLADWWGLDRPAAIPGYVVRKGLARMRARVR